MRNVLFLQDNESTRKKKNRNLEFELELESLDLVLSDYYCQNSKKVWKGAKHLPVKKLPSVVSWIADQKQ